MLRLCLSFALCAVATLTACATTSAQDQQQALSHQHKSDKAAAEGRYGVAASEQRKAADSHHDAVTKAIDEGSPIPAQPRIGDGPDGGAR